MSDPQSTNTVFRYEVPIDDLWHPVSGCSTPLFVAARRSNPVEFWAWSRPGLPVRWFRIFGTGQPVPDGAKYRGSVVTNGGLFVWHLFEDRNPDEGQRAPA